MTRAIDLAEVAPACLPLGPDGVSELEAVPLRELAERFGTPLWIVSRAQLVGNIHELHDALARHVARFEIAYSMKANNNRVVVQTLAREGALVDCSSEHELALALAAGVPPAKIVVNGNGKASSYLDAAVRLGVHQINVDSLAEVERLAQLAALHAAPVRCVVRCKLGYRRLLEQDPSYERTLRVAEGKFGSSVESGEALRVVRRLHEDPLLRYAGLSHHAGFAGYRADYSAERQLMHLEECARELREFADTLQRELGVATERIDVGGGLRSGRYVLLSTPGASTDAALHALPSAEQYAAAVAAGIGPHDDPADAPIVQLETGGFQVGNAVVLLTSVQDVKDVTRLARRRYVTVDAAMTMFVTRGLTRVGHPVAVVDRPLDAPLADVPVEIVGPTCAYDSIAEDVALPDVDVGDLLLLLHQGAYCEVTSTQFNAFPRPAVALVDGDRATLVRRRETLADVLVRETTLHENWPGAEA